MNQKAVWRQRDQKQLGADFTERLTQGCDQCGATAFPLVTFPLAQNDRARNNELVLCPAHAREVGESLVADANQAGRLGKSRRRS